MRILYFILLTSAFFFSMDNNLSSMDNNLSSVKEIFYNESSMDNKHNNLEKLDYVIKERGLNIQKFISDKGALNTIAKQILQSPITCITDKSFDKNHTTGNVNTMNQALNGWNDRLLETFVGKNNNVKKDEQFVYISSYNIFEEMPVERDDTASMLFNIFFINSSFANLLVNFQSEINTNQATNNEKDMGKNIKDFFVKKLPNKCPIGYFIQAFLNNARNFINYKKTYETCMNDVLLKSTKYSLFEYLKCFMVGQNNIFERNNIKGLQGLQIVINKNQYTYSSDECQFSEQLMKTLCLTVSKDLKFVNSFENFLFVFLIYCQSDDFEGDESVQLEVINCIKKNVNIVLSEFKEVLLTMPEETGATHFVKFLNDKENLHNHILCEMLFVIYKQLKVGIHC